jgi:hypothetical protein
LALVAGVVEEEEEEEEEKEKGKPDEQREENAEESGEQTADVRPGKDAVSSSRAYRKTLFVSRQNGFG